MAVTVNDIKNTFQARDNGFYQRYYFYFLISVSIICILAISLGGLVLYQTINRPLPVFDAVQPDGRKMVLTPFSDPNLMPETILRWASKGATLAYNFDFYNYNQQLQLARPYFTDTGWRDFINSLDPLISTITQNKLFVYGVVSGTPVISNEGELPDVGYTWRVQIPFTVTYLSLSPKVKRNYYVILTIVRVPTTVNPQGIGINQFVMV